MASSASSAASTVTSLIVGEAGIVSQADQQGAALTISGTLSATLPAGSTVQVLLPSGVPRQATVAPDGTDFSLLLTGTATLAFDVPGRITAFIADAGGNQTGSLTQPFTVAEARAVVPVTATPADFAVSGATALALSGDGKAVAFVANQTVGNTVQFGLYVQRLDTGTLTLVSPAGRDPGLSADGTLVAYVESQNNNQVFVKNLTTGLVTQLTDPAGNGSSSGLSTTRPSIANDGTVVFESAGETALRDYPLYQQVYIGRVTSGGATTTLISAAGNGTPGNGISEYGTISADGSTVVFLSTSTNLLGGTDPNAAALTGSFQIYARALRDNPVTGQRAGTTVLVSTNPDGTVSNGSDFAPVVSGNGRFVVFESATDGQAHLKDLLTGVTRTVFTNAAGVVANASSFGATLSADGTTVVFQSLASNLLGAGPEATDLTHSQQVYAKNLATGRVTLLSEGGYTPGDAISQDPAISANGTVAVFSSSADNLAPGVLGSANRSPTLRGYVTAVAGTPSVAVDTAATTTAATTLVLTGTIDAAHAATPIILTDAADPGFFPVTATVTPGADPYFDTWTATVIFTVAGPQTITATAGTTTAQASTTLLNAPSLRIDPVNGTAAVVGTGQPAHVTVVTGANPAGAGRTVTLFLLTSQGRLLTLGTGATGADGRWSVSVPESAFGSQSSESDALVAETTDASGTIIRASTSLSLSLPPPVRLYSYRFTFADGSFYTGTVADDGTYGYTPGQTVATSAGRYVIGAAGGTTTQLSGTVTAATYYDGSTAASYATASAGKAVPDGASGLGSETDSITGPGGTLGFGGGTTEARQSAATAYGFAFLYNDGSAYYGSVVGGANSGYQSGQTLKTNSGTYKITGSLGATTAAVGTVNTSLYYDAASAATYVPTSTSAGQASGVQGLGSEVDTIKAPSGATTKFGLSGENKAALRLVLTYTFAFYYKDGSAYYGAVVDDGSYGYSLYKQIKVASGTYVINGVSATPLALPHGTVLTAPGEVSVYTYYDVSTKQYSAPGHYEAGEIASYNGLGNELDYITGLDRNLYFGSNGTLEAKQYPNELFYFTFTYKDGSSYFGSVVDDGSYGYFKGETITTSNGHYTIDSSTGLTAGEGGLVSGDVYTRNYFDITSGGPYVTLYQGANLPSGTNGLLSESDAVLDPTGIYRTFGFGGQNEAKLTPYTLLNFVFVYKDGSYYKGQLASDEVHGPQNGQIITNSYGYYDIFAYAGATAAIPETVTILEYYDVTNNTFYTPHPFGGAANFGASGLGEAVGYVDGPLRFGYSGEYEAKHAPNTSWEFEFFYKDGSYYVGHVVDDGKSGFHPGFIEPTPFGHYNVDGTTEATSLPIGSVTLSYYVDVSNHKAYTPTGQGAGGIDGTSGLGSEYADTTENGQDLGFGFGGQYEAKQGNVRHFTFTFNYDNGSSYSGDYASTVLYGPGTTLYVTGGTYLVTGLTDLHSSLLNGTVFVSSYFDSSTGQTYTPVRYAGGKASGSADLGSELDYIVAGGGLRSFGGPNHTEANTSIRAFSPFLTTAVYAFDGPLQGATVGYLNPKALPGTLSIDPAQPTATTNADGSYQLGAGTGPLVLTGGTDTATGLPFKGVLESAGAGAVLSPLTTLLEATASALGDTGLAGIASAEALLSTALGLPAGLDLTTYAPGVILRDDTSAPEDIAAAETVYRAGARLLDAEALIDAAGGNSLQAIDTVAASLANGSLTDLKGLFPLIEDGGLAPPAETAIKTIFAATNTLVDQNLANLTVPGAILNFISGASIALQGDAATALAAPGADDASLADSYVQSLPLTLRAADDQAFGITPACYCQGTAILTTEGELPVEALAIGMLVVTRDGPAQPVRWLGRRSYGGRFLARNPGIQPICIRAGALGPATPRRDLLVSPCHAMFIDEVLIHAAALVNGTSILRVPALTEIHYFHVELPGHDVIQAEGAWSESFIDDDSRRLFHNAADFARLYPDHPGDPAASYAPRIDSGEQLERIRRDIAGRWQRRGLTPRTLRRSAVQVAP